MPGFDAALRMEWVRLTTLRSTAVVLALAVGLGACAALLLATASRGERIDTELGAILLTSGAALVPLPIAAVLMAVLGVLTVGHDYRHGLVRPVLAAVPQRSSVVLARLYVLTGVAAVVTVVSVTANAGLGFLVTGQRPPLDVDVLRALAGYVLLVVLWTWLGAAATWLMRSTAAVLTALFLVPLVVEPLIQGLSLLEPLSWLEPITKWLPFAAGRVLVLTSGATDTGGAEVTALQGGLVFGGLVAVLLTAGWVRFATTDA
jgi:ABC-type transport system involved in multi-copper enzyme maturation permease subunit